MMWMNGRPQKQLCIVFGKCRNQNSVLFLYLAQYDPTHCSITQSLFTVSRSDSYLLQRSEPWHYIFFPRAAYRAILTFRGNFQKVSVRETLIITKNTSVGLQVLLVDCQVYMYHSLSTDCKWLVLAPPPHLKLHTKIKIGVVVSLVLGLGGCKWFDWDFGTPYFNSI